MPTAYIESMGSRNSPDTTVSWSCTIPMCTTARIVDVTARSVPIRLDLLDEKQQGLKIA
jgi:hypothetical protein